MGVNKQVNFSFEKTTTIYYMYRKINAYFEFEKASKFLNEMYGLFRS